jgi:hypothetical protein
MHLMIPFASSAAAQDRQALQDPSLPHLERLLARLVPTQRTEGDEYNLSTPHECALAAALGLAGGDGQLPWAARAAAHDGIATGDLAWGLLSPVHWHVGPDHITMGDPQALQLDEGLSRELMEALRPLFEDDGWVLVWGAPTRWYVAHESLAELPTASLDRVIGRNPDLWMPDRPEAATLRRLMSEVQMLLYRHPANDAREAAGLPAVNSIWLSGCGMRQAERQPEPVVIDTLRAPALQDDWAAWQRAWRAVDAGPLRDLLARARGGEAVQLTLAGERHAQRYESSTRSWLAYLAARFKRPSTAAALQAL